MLSTKEMQNVVTKYHQYYQKSFDGVFRELKNEFNNLTLKGNHVNDDFIRHIIKGWSKNENVNYGIHGHQRRMPKGSLDEGIRHLLLLIGISRPVVYHSKIYTRKYPKDSRVFAFAMARWCVMMCPCVSDNSLTSSQKTRST